MSARADAARRCRARGHGDNVTDVGGRRFCLDCSTWLDQTIVAVLLSDDAPVRQLHRTQPELPPAPAAPPPPHSITVELDPHTTTRRVRMGQQYRAYCSCGEWREHGAEWFCRKQGHRHVVWNRRIRGTG